MLWLFSFKGRIGRLTYALWSLGVFLSPQLVFFPLYLLSPHRATRNALGAAYLLLVAWVLAALAFRRVKDADLSGWIAVLAALPFIQLPVIIYLCFVPSEPRTTRSRLIATVGLLAGAALTVLAVGVGALVFGVYREGIPLHVRFVPGVLVLLTLPPFVIGAATAYIENCYGDVGAERTARSALTATALGYFLFTALLIGAATSTGFLGFFLFDAIGALRVIVAALFVLGVALIGGALGRAIATRSIQAPFPMKGIIPLVTGLGIVFLASAVQIFGTNWLGQTCPYPGPCFRPEWLAVGFMLSAVAYLAWKVVNRRRH